MIAEVHYTPFHPKWYRKPVSVWWWLQSWVYAKFVLRELTSLGVAYFALIQLWKFHAIRNGACAYAQFLDRMKSPLFFVPNCIAIFLVLFHAVTWVNLTPKAMVVRLSGRRVPDAVIVGTNYLVWFVVSVFLAWLSQRG